MIDGVPCVDAGDGRAREIIQKEQRGSAFVRADFEHPHGTVPHGRERREKMRKVLREPVESQLFAAKPVFSFVRRDRKFGHKSPFAARSG